MHNNVLRHNVERLYTAIALVWIPFISAIVNISQWKNTTVSASWAIVNNPYSVGFQKDRLLKSYYIE